MNTFMNAFAQTFRRTQLLAAVSLLACAGVAGAAISQHTTSSSFNTAMGGGPSESYNFTGLGGTTQPGNFYSSPQSFTSGTFDFSVAPETTGLIVTYTGNAAPAGIKESFSTDISGEDLIITFTANNVYAVAGDFFFVDASAGIIGDAFSIRVTDNNSVTSTINMDPTGSGSGVGATFAGFTTDSTTVYFTKLEILNAFDGFSGKYSAFDNLVVGSPVPEAPTWIATAMLGLVAVTRVWRKRQSSR